MEATVPILRQVLLRRKEGIISRKVLGVGEEILIQMDRNPEKNYRMQLNQEKTYDILASILLIAINGTSIRFARHMIEIGRVSRGLVQIDGDASLPTRRYRGSGSNLNDHKICGTGTFPPLDGTSLQYRLDGLLELFSFHRVLAISLNFSLFPSKVFRVEANFGIRVKIRKLILETQNL
ncbi:hypothetical protein Tco_0241323 [Tanacetum coccineum]|uniref:Uncharacterized protein n=1 Tax=Tanacetum coccineum TaxID=301880 RepID=A0ABQ5FSU7_9ASTR